MCAIDRWVVDTDGIISYCMSYTIVVCFGSNIVLDVQSELKTRDEDLTVVIRYLSANAWLMKRISLILQIRQILLE